MTLVRGKKISTEELISRFRVDPELLVRTLTTPTKCIKREISDRRVLCIKPYAVDRNNVWIGLEL